MPANTPPQPEKTALELRSELLVAKAQFGQGEITVDELFAAAQRYQDAIIAYLRRTNKRVHRPSLGYLIRVVG